MIYCRILFIASVLLLSQTTLQAQNISTTKSDSLTTIDHLVAFASKHLHIPYRSGGSSKKGFDCSGFVRYCYDQFNILLPHSSAQQAKHGANIPLEEAKPGDLVFFNGQRSGSKNIGHVGIITDVSGPSIRFIHSAFKGGIRYDMIDAAYYRKRLVAIRRLVQ